MITTNRALFVIAFIFSIVFFFLSLMYLDPRYLETATALMYLSAVLQLEIAGLFSKIVDDIREASKTGEAPDHLVQRTHILPYESKFSTVLDYIFFNKKFGFYLIIASLLLQALSVWVRF